MEFEAQAEGLALRGSRNISSLVLGGKAEVRVVYRRVDGWWREGEGVTMGCFHSLWICVSGLCLLPPFSNLLFLST